MFSTMDLHEDYLNIYLDSTLQDTYEKVAGEGIPLCSPGDFLVLYNKNLTHTANSFSVGISADTNQVYTDEGIAMRNFFLYVDTCDISCATCDGPKNVKKIIIIFCNRIKNLNFFFRHNA